MPVPITVIGGYLGAGKTTLVNRLLADPGGRRLGVVVNDFGALGIDAEVLSGSGDVVSLPNGCVCCSLGADLAATLDRLMELEVDHVVVEVSGVADPTAAAAWCTVPRFSHGGVIVLAAADTVETQATDRYIGADVHRQLQGADLVVLTKVDRVSETARAHAAAWVQQESGGAPLVESVHGDLPAEIALGQTGTDTCALPPGRHDSTYTSWTWTSPEPVTNPTAFLDELPSQILRLKGRVRVAGKPGHSEVQVVGRHREVDEHPDAEIAESGLVAIAAGPQLELRPPT